MAEYDPNPPLTAQRWDPVNGRPAPGFRWCPACQGEGVVWTMQPNPDLTEYSEPCTFAGCAEGEGIVPDE